MRNPFGRRRRIALALQGGGAHGAFTWGVLDRFARERGLVVEALSGASAGACNAAVFASGWAAKGPVGARFALYRFWRGIADRAPQPTFSEEITAFSLGLVAHLFSPYELNPSDVDPLRDILAGTIDVARLRDERAPRLLIAATDVESGSARLFDNADISLDAIRASAALPLIAHAVQIDGRHYWDGGIVANPPLLPLLTGSRARDVVLVRINPMERDGVPRTAAAIRTRTAELMFGASLATELDRLAELRAIARRPAAWLVPRLRRLATVRLHTIDGGATLVSLSPASRILPTWPLLLRLRDAGRTAASEWLNKANRRRLL